MPVHERLAGNMLWSSPTSELEVRGRGARFRSAGAVGPCVSCLRVLASWSQGDRMVYHPAPVTAVEGSLGRLVRCRARRILLA